jgi:hypothetical protein
MDLGGSQGARKNFHSGKYTGAPERRRKIIEITINHVLTGFSYF